MDSNQNSLFVHEMAMVAAIVGIVTFVFKPVQDAIGNFITEPIQDHLRYLCCFSDNVKDLKKEAPELENKQREVQSRVETAQNNAEIIVPRVVTWLNEVSEIQTEKLKIDGEINTAIDGGCSIVGCRACPLSKRVKKMAEKMKELRQENSVDLTTDISHPAQPEALAPINIGSTNEFDSRKSVEDEIMASLRDEGTIKVGICGMGGVGKTTMAKKIMQRAREELGFQETVIAVVGQKVDEERIQGDIATSLGLKWKGDSSSKAHELRQRLSEGSRRSFIVIDDVWEGLDLGKLGIPCSNTCKVLITSRNSHILDVEKLHAVDVLSKEEAWELFKSKAGSCIEKQNVVGIARQVVEECKGLPLALVTVGVALKNKETTHLWNNALRQLESANPTDTPEVIEPVYQQLRLSYDYLKADARKSLFLMCCLFPEDSNIPLERLAIMCKGLLHLNEDIKSSRDTTFTLVELLKDRFLLLEGNDENHVRMHDVVRDVAIFIAAEEKRIKCDECTWISPNIGERIGAHGRSSPSPFPNLRLLWIDRESRDKKLEIHKNFFGGMRGLKVIMIKCRSLQRLPDTIGLLTNLRTLVLEDCESLECISVVGKLVNLEILICRSCRMIESLPAEIGNLRKLKLLELSQCWKLKTIVPGIISNLRELEELIVEYFDGWEAWIVEGERKNAPLCELEHLSKLTRLKIRIRDKGLAAESFNLPPNLLKFHITFGDFMNDLMNSSWEKKLKLELSADVSWGKFLQECVGSVEHMYIKGDGSSVLDLQLAQNLRRLEIIECSKVKKLVTDCPDLEILYLEKVNELGEIRIGIQENHVSNFNNLSSIFIKECGSLRRLFSSAFMGSGGCFLGLERLEIHNCKMMEQVFMCYEDENNITHIPLVFPNLKFINLEWLPNLKCFIKGMQAIEFPQLDEMRIWTCISMKELVYSGIWDLPGHRQRDGNEYFHLSCDTCKVTFGNLSKFRIYEVKNFFCLQAPINSFAGLSKLVVSGVQCVNIFSFSWTERSCLPQLEKLEISRCPLMEEVILWKEEEDHMDINHMITLFPKLKDLSLDTLPRLTSLSKGIENIIFYLPPKMCITNCPLLESCASEIAVTHLFCNPHLKVTFDRLKELHICGSWKDKTRRNWCPQIQIKELFRGVCKLSVSSLQGMESLFPCLIAEMMENIKDLSIYYCVEMVRVIEDKDDACETTPPILLFPKLERLSLFDLHKLKSFCEWRCHLKLPSLLTLKISKCDMMKELTSGRLYTPKLKAMEIDQHKLNGIDVSSPILQLSSLRKKAEKEKHNLNGKDVSSPLQLSTRLRKTVEKRANVDEIPAEIEGIANNRALFNVNAMLDQTEKYTGSFTKARVLREVGSSSETPKLTPDSPISKSIEEEVRIGDIVVKTIKELLEDEESGEFWILATIDNITQIGGDSYLACNACYKELTQEEARKLMCGKCESIDIAAKLRHKIEVKVDDGTATTNFLIWVKEGMELIGKSVGKDGVVNKLPREINNLQNMKAFFEVNVLPNQKGPFTVLQATNNEEMIYSIKARKSILEKGKMVKEDTYQEVDENTSVDLTDDDSQ